MMEERIVSRKNPLLQQVKKLLSSRKAREEAGLFVADGTKLLQEAVKYFPGLELKAGNVWRANFYKCGGMKGYDHWLTWSPIVGELNFHLPEFFSELKFV